MILFIYLVNLIYLLVARPYKEAFPFFVMVVIELLMTIGLTMVLLLAIYDYLEIYDNVGTRMRLGYAYFGISLGVSLILLIASAVGFYQMISGIF
jgi:hypothetical protein